jgi:YHS domain-containing protein
MIRSPLLLFVLSALLLIGAMEKCDAEPLPNTFCPVMKEERASASFKGTHEGHDVFFCCKDCVRDFEENPSAYVESLPQFTENERTPVQQKFDAIWNAGKMFAGLSIGGLVLLSMFVWRKVFGVGKFTSAKAVASVVALMVAGEGVSAHLNRLAVARDMRDLEMEDWIHFATFHDYGYPPTPEKPKVPASVSSTYYRGNDERNPALYNGGYYRTATFEISICDAAGSPRLHEDSAEDPNDLFLKVMIRRAPGTADYFWQADRMALMYATSSTDKFQGRDVPLIDSVSLTTLEPEQAWEFRYPLGSFYRDASRRCAGIVYICEKRFDKVDKLMGGRFHYGFQFDLDLSDGSLQPESDLWMGAFYRSRIVPVWHIPGREWLSTEPIPLVEGENGTRDPELLGITADKENQN